MKTPEDEEFERIERENKERSHNQVAFKSTPSKVNEPKRTWVGLTDKEIEECWDGDLSPYKMQCIREIESRLREKNT
jgi:hypothetical protein